MRIVFSIGGSILAPDTVSKKTVDEISHFLIGLSAEHSIAAVVGGGTPARKAIKKARDNGYSWTMCDWEGIKKTRENAGYLLKGIGSHALEMIPESLYEAQKLFGEKILVMGGTEPGHSTDAVATLLSDWVKADIFINASNVDAVYDKDPKKHSDAKPIDKIHIDNLIELLDDGGFNAGEYPLLDHVALRVIKRAQLRSIILDGNDTTNMKAYVEGKHFRGTEIFH